MFLFNEAQQNPFIVEVSAVLLSVQAVLIGVDEALVCNNLCPLDDYFTIIEGALRKVLYSVDVLKNSNSLLGISIGLCLRPVAQVPGQSCPWYL